MEHSQKSLIVLFKQGGLIPAHIETVRDFTKTYPKQFRNV